jgi:hypothetical protein
MVSWGYRAAGRIFYIFVIFTFRCVHYNYFDRFPIQEIVGSNVLRRTKFGVVWRLLLYMQERQKRGYWHTLHCLFFALLMQLDPIADRTRHTPPERR